MKKYKPIRIHHMYFGYGYWWKDYFFFFGKRATRFAVVPMFRELMYAVYANNGKKIGYGPTCSWSISRQIESTE